jgi:hypothetical protein
MVTELGDTGEEGLESSMSPSKAAIANLPLGSLTRPAVRPVVQHSEVPQQLLDTAGVVESVVHLQSLPCNLRQHPLIRCGKLWFYKKLSFREYTRVTEKDTHDRC